MCHTSFNSRRVGLQNLALPISTPSEAGGLKPQNATQSRPTTKPTCMQTIDNMSPLSASELVSAWMIDVFISFRFQNQTCYHQAGLIQPPFIGYPTPAHTHK